MDPQRAERVSHPGDLQPARVRLSVGLTVALAILVAPVHSQVGNSGEPRSNSQTSLADLARRGQELARRVAVDRDPAADSELRDWAGKLVAGRSDDVRAAVQVLRGAVAEIVAPRRLAADLGGATETARLRSLFEKVADGARGADLETMASFWTALETVAEPLGTGGIARRTRHAEVLARTLSPSYDWLERLLVAWGLIDRGTSFLETTVTEVDRIQPNGLSRIQATVISAPTGRVRVDEVVELIEDLTEWDAERQVIVVADGSNYERLVACCSSDHVAVRPSFGRPFSPWPRDAMTFARSGDGSPLLMMRPNVVPGRELDALMGRSLLQFGDLERVASQPVRWLTSPVPFHNGQILFTPGETWVSIHSLERRALEILGLDAIPAASFSSQTGLETYLDAVRRAAGEYEVLFSQPVGLVHPLPTPGPADKRETEMWRLAGGAGWDLDSLVTILPRVGDLPTTLVGSTGLGQAMLASTSDQDLRAWLDVLHLKGASVEEARAALSAPLDRRSSLQQFLDVTAEHLSSAGHEVVRVPALVLPQSLAPTLKSDVLIGVHNVVLERGLRGPRAEGFRSGLSPLDRMAGEIFRAAGYELRLLQPISDSMLLNAGYRCSTNHLRSSEEVGPGELRHLTSRRSVELWRESIVD